MARTANQYGLEVRAHYSPAYYFPGKINQQFDDK